MENLPEETATEILSRLPVKSIIRCKAVRKEWYALSKNPNFVSKHLSMAQQQFNRSNNLLFSIRWIGSYSYQIMSIINSNHREDDEEEEEPLEEIIPLPCSIQLCENIGLGLGVIGHCDGLVALDNSKNGLIVCNPATREFRVLPVSSFHPFPYCKDVVSDLGKHSAVENMFGFGFDSKLNDYKLVRALLFYLTTKTGFCKRTYKAEVFCIRSDSCWRQLDNVTIDSFLRNNWGDDIREPLCDGILYWCCQEDETNKHVLVTFNVVDEVFGKLPMPQPASEVLDDWGTSVSVGVYNDSLAVYIYPKDVIDEFDIWVMKDVGPKGSWTKQVTIKRSPGASHLCFVNSSDEEFLYLDSEDQLAIHNRVTMESKSLPLPGSNWRAISYMKTLVSVE